MSEQLSPDEHRKLIEEAQAHWDRSQAQRAEWESKFAVRVRKEAWRSLGCEDVLKWMRPVGHA